MSSLSSSLYDACSLIAPARVTSFLLSRGWRVVEAMSSKYHVYTSERFRGLELTLPNSDTYRDYPIRIWELVQSIAVSLQREPVSLVHELLLPPGDMLRFTIDSESSRVGAVPLGAGLELLRGAQEAILSVARSVVTPSSFHQGRPAEQPKELLGQCKMAQTERGSFVANVFCPVVYVPRVGELIEDTDVTPFARKVTKQLLKSVSAISTATSLDSLNSLTSTDALEMGVSANLCDALNIMQPEDGTSVLKVNCAYGPEIPDDARELGAIAAIGEVRILAEQREKISAVSRVLKPRIEESRREDIRGEVMLLQRRSSGNDEEEGGEVEIRYLGDDTQLKARLKLDAADYQAACDAHKSKKQVRVRGVLDKSGKSARFVDGAMFNVLEDFE